MLLDIFGIGVWTHAEGLAGSKGRAPNILQKYRFLQQSPKHFTKIQVSAIENKCTFC